MNITFLTIYIMLWTLGVSASYAFVMTVTKKDASPHFLHWASLIALLSYGTAWFFGVLYYVHPDTMAKLSRVLPSGSNVWLQSVFAQWRDGLFFSFLLVPILSGILAAMLMLPKAKNVIMSASIVITILGATALLLAIMIV